MSKDGIDLCVLLVTTPNIWCRNPGPTVQAKDESGGLTPAHFLIGRRLTAIPTGPELETNGRLAKEFRLRQKLADDFWRRWQREYLTTLRSFHEVRQQQASAKLRVGNVALLQEDVRPRHMWRRLSSSNS